jgi:hypothetical protein
MPNTTNYGWQTPSDSDLVKDGASAIRTLGSSIDTTVFNNASAGIPKTIVDAKGDLIAGTASDTVARLAVGTNDQILMADSTAATGMKWATPAAPSAGANWSLLNSGGTSLSGSDLVTISGISGKDKIMVVIRAASSASSASTIGVRLNTEIVDYWGVGWRYTDAATYASGQSVAYNLDEYQIPVGKMGNSAGATVSGYFLLTGGASSGVKVWQCAGGSADAGTAGIFYTLGGTWSNSATVSSVSIKSTSNNFDSGTVFVYGSA